MAITRRERREFDSANSRHPHSGRRLQTLPATSLSVRGSCHTRKTNQPDSQVVTHPDVIAGEAVPKLSEGRSNDTVPQPLLYKGLNRTTATGHRS
jgi:hypothetical protein